LSYIKNKFEQIVVYQHSLAMCTQVHMLPTTHIHALESKWN